MRALLGIGVVNEPLAWPVGADVDVFPGEPPLEEEEEEVVNNDDETEELAGPDATPVVALEAVDEGEVADAAAIVAGRVEAVEVLLRKGTRDAVVDALGAQSDVLPGVHLLDLVVEPFSTDLASSHRGDGFAGREDDIILFGLGEGGHMGGEHLGDATNLCADDVEATTGGFDDNGAEGFGQGGMEINVTADHDVANLLVADGAEHLNAVLQDVGLNHLFEVNGLGARTGDDETCVWVVFKHARDGSDEKIGSLVVEETRDDDNSDDIARAEALGRGIMRGIQGKVGPLGRRDGVVTRTEVVCDDGIGDNRDHEGIQRRPEDSVFFARGG